MMKLFKLKADVDFYAEDIEDAFDKLNNHFFYLANSGDFEDPQIIVKGDIEIGPLEETDPGKPDH